ncbi:hypothetical protein IWX49DRAFT_589867 [Phyllosticta citricarpa]
MPRSISSKSKSKASRGHQNASPRRSARLQGASSTGASHSTIDRLKKQKPAEFFELNPPTEQGAGKKRKRDETTELPAESDSPSQKEQGTDCKRIRSEDTEPEYSPPGQSKEQETLQQETLENAKISPFAQQPEEEARRSPALEPDDEEFSQPYFTGTWHGRGNPVDHWVQHNVWPSNYAESIDPESENMSSVTRTPSVRRRAKERYSKEIWDIELPQADKNLPNTPETRARLLKHNVVTEYLRRHSQKRKEGLTESAKETCQRLEASQAGSSLPKGYFDRVLERSKLKGETKVVQDIGPLVAPRVEPLYYDGDQSLEKMTESVDESWSTCVPLLGYNAPTPDYAAGYHFGIAFTEKQQSVLRLFQNSDGDSLVLVTPSLCFPFLSFEAKGTSVGISAAEQQNVEDVLIASRGVIELFKRANLADEIHLEIIAFSIAFNDDVVSVHGHFADVRGQHPIFYRHCITEHGLRRVESACYNMVKYIYKVWAQDHWKRICRAIDILSTMPGYMASTSSQASLSIPGGNRTPQSRGGSSMGPPSEPRSASMPPLAPRPTTGSSTSNVRPQRDLTPTTSPNRDSKKPKRSG